MDNSNRKLTCDASSLLDLKAELYKKQEACKVAKAGQSFNPTKRMTLKGKEITSKKDKKVRPTSEKPKDTYEEEMLEKSRKILEAKAKVYDQIVEKKLALDEEFSDQYLVDFQRKELFEFIEKDKEPASSSKTETELNVNTEDSQKIEMPPKAPEVQHTLGIDVENPLPYHSLEEKINTVEPPTTGTDGPTHYQNVRYNEIRDHGVGYFAFSEVEKKRQEQMETLKNLRQETIENKQFMQKVKQKRQAMLQARLAKVCQRRNIDTSVVQDYTQKEEKVEDTEKVEPQQTPDASDINANNGKPNTNDVSVPQKKIRPWDIGKGDSDLPTQPAKKKLTGAEKWVEHKRKERNEEFAPPDFYFDSSEPKTKKSYQRN